MSERLRLFVALELPAEVRSALAGWCDRAAPPDVRRVASENLHVTLVFLGSRSPKEATSVAALLAALAASHPLAPQTTAGALWLASSLAGVLSVALDDESSLAALQAATSSTLGDAIGFEGDGRRFRPHVTVGRVARGARVSASAIDGPPALTFAVPALTLYRSRSAVGGSRYEVLASSPM